MQPSAKGSNAFEPAISPSLSEVSILFSKVHSNELHATQELDVRHLLKTQCKPELLRNHMYSAPK